MGGYLMLFVSIMNHEAVNEAFGHHSGGINAFINDKLSDESIYEDVDKLMKDLLDVDR